YWLAQEKLRFSAQDAKDKDCGLRRADILIFGGDEVYPVASHEKYEDRLVKPYQSALEPKFNQRARAPKPETLPLPHVYAIPGNHDWYDTLTAFTRVFCDEKVKEFGGGSWKAPQNRSYFALRLPGNWWLIGIDLQLNSDLDTVQLQYFEMVAEKMRPGDRIILCSPEPYWAYQIAYGENDRNK